MREIKAQKWSRMGNSTGWQHPEAWLGSVTSVSGNPRLNEEAFETSFRTILHAAIADRLYKLHINCIKLLYMIELLIELEIMDIR